jgi:acyl carrier protein
MIAREDAFIILTEVLLAEVPTLRREQITPRAAFQHDLGLDSIALMNLLVVLEKRLGRSLDLLPWLERARSTGDYSLGSIVDYVRAQPERE